MIIVDQHYSISALRPVIISAIQGREMDVWQTAEALLRELDGR